MLAITPRDKYIGWPRDIRLKNLVKIANNYRFCMIKKGYGSKVLSLLGKRASKDWERIYGDKLMLLETMVEPPFVGTVYKSASWTLVGKTKGLTMNRRVSKSLHLHGSPARAKRVREGTYEQYGYKHCGNKYVENLKPVTPKLIYVKPLYRNWKDILNRK